MFCYICSYHSHLLFRLLYDVLAAKIEIRGPFMSKLSCAQKYRLYSQLLEFCEKNIAALLDVENGSSSSSGSGNFGNKLVFSLLCHAFVDLSYIHCLAGTFEGSPRSYYQHRNSNEFLPLGAFSFRLKSKNNHFLPASH